jgi:hypothetical protein
MSKQKNWDTHPDVRVFDSSLPARRATLIDPVQALRES